MTPRPDARPLPPLPAPLRPWCVVPAVAAGVAGTGLLYESATRGGAVRLIAGGVLFAIGLALAGYPFVLASAWQRRARRNARARAPSGRR